MNKSLIIGKGEVGAALFKVLRGHYDIYIRDIPELNISEVKYLHICYPYSRDFVRITKKYIKQYKPKYTIIHSTVPVGTSKKCKAFHSPVRGVHTDLVKGIKTFVKYLAPKDNELKRYFKKAGIKIELVEKTKTTEALKVWSTTQYGWFIILEKIIYEWCRKNKIDFNIIYTDANKTYNEGYEKLGMKHVSRPILKHVKGKIGGHCVLNNCKLLKSKITSFILYEK